MYHYVTLLWNESDERQSETARQLTYRIRRYQPNWNISHECKGLKVFESGQSIGTNRAYPLKHNGGVIVGKLFKSGNQLGDDFAEPIFDAQLTEALVETGGQYLIDHFWGSYVAFVREGNPGGRTYVIRGPCSRLPCFSVGYRGLEVYFSRMEDCAQLGINNFSMDWSFIVNHIACRGGLRLSGTALNEVSQLTPGECEIKTANGKSRTAYWDPVAIAARDVMADPLQATSKIKNVTQHCISAWASAHKSILLLLSGGLDSTIVLSCLSKSPTRPEVVGLNCATPGAEGDEREFARLAARRVEIKLLEEVINPEAVRFEDLEAIERSAFPAIYTSDLLHSRRQGRASAAIGATAIFTGQYGDGVFLEGGMQYRTADFVRLHGLSLQILKLAYEEARMQNLTIWSVLSSSLKHKWRLPPLTYYSRLLEDSSFLSDDARASVVEQSLQPHMIADLNAVPRGKLIQILNLLIPFGYGDPFGNTTRPENIHVLGSQPLLELSLRIPTYVLSANGIGRALARKAFANEIPAKIAYRRTKGACSNMLQQTFAANHGYMREQLLDGLLVREGIVDRNALESCLSDKEAISVSIAAELPVLFSTEAWLQRWKSDGKKRAVA